MQLTETIFELSKYKEKFKSHIPYINERIEKCVMYNYLDNTINFWIDTEIMSVIKYWNRLYTTINNGRLSKQEYIDFMREEFGKDDDDAFTNLLAFYQENIKRKKYAIVYPTDSMAHALKIVYDKFIEYISTYYSTDTKDIIKVQEYLHNIMGPGKVNMDFDFTKNELFVEDYDIAVSIYKDMKKQGISIDINFVADGATITWTAVNEDQYNKGDDIINKYINLDDNI